MFVWRMAHCTSTHRAVSGISPSYLPLDEGDTPYELEPSNPVTNRMGMRNQTRGPCSSPAPRHQTLHSSSTVESLSDLRPLQHSSQRNSSWLETPTRRLRCLQSAYISFFPAYVRPMRATLFHPVRRTISSDQASTSGVTPALQA